MKNLCKILLAASFIGGSTFSASAASIGVSFTSDRDNTQMDAATVAGVVPSTGWVSTDGGANPVAGASGSIDNAGVTVNWTSNGTWNTTNGTGSGDALLMNGYIDAIGVNGAANVSLSGLDAVFEPGYDIYVYFGSDGNGRTGQVAGSGLSTYSYSTFSNDPNGGGGFVPGDFLQTTDTGTNFPNANYALFSGLSGDSQSFDLVRGSSNSGFHGVQVVGEMRPVPEGGATMALLSASLVGISLLRRKLKR